MYRIEFSALLTLALPLFSSQGFCAHAAEIPPEIVTAVSTPGFATRITLETQVGQIIDAAKLQRDVKTLWRSGQFSDIHVETTPDPTGTEVVFRAEPRRTMRLRHYQVVPPTPGVDLKLTPDSQIDPWSAQEVANSVRQKLVGSGYPFVRVSPSLHPVGNNQADLTLHVDEGKRVDITKTMVTGDLGAKGAGARRALKSTSSKLMIPGIPGIWKGWRIQPGYSENALRSDLVSLQSFYYERGYFGADIKADPVDTSSSAANLHFYVQAGPRYAIRQIEFPSDAKTHAIRVDSDAAFPAHALCAALLDERRKAERQGVVDFAAKIEIRDVPGRPVTPGPDARKWADLIVNIQRGRAYTVGRIEFLGNRGIRDTTIRRAMLINEEGPLDQTLLRKSVAHLNRTGFFEPIAEKDVILTTPPDSDHADVTIRLREQKARHWYLSGPVGPMSIGGSLQFAIGSRLPPWGQGLLELATYTVSAHLVFLPKPLGSLIPGLPNRRFLSLLTIQRPLLPGQTFLSGFTLVPQAGWKGMLIGYGASQTRGFLNGAFESEHSYAPGLPVAVAHAATGDASGIPDGTLYCKPPVTPLDRTRMVGGLATRLAFSFLPF